MSETAISSQIVSEVAPQSSESAIGASGQQSANNPQASEFNSLFNTAATSLLPQPIDFSAEEQSLSSLNEFLHTNNLVTGQTALNPLLDLSGKQLPNPLHSNLPHISQGGIPNPLLAANNQIPVTPLEGQLKTSVAAIVPADENILLTDPEAALDADVFTSQLSTNFTEKNLPNLKQLNAQILNQMMSQALPKQTINQDNNVLLGSAPGIMVNQSLSMSSSEAVLPAITVTPENAQWNNQVGERINWMVNNQIQRADIRLDPPELGNLDVRLQIAKDNQANIVFHVTNATAKEAIESAIPRLREMFEQQGLDLANVDVEQHDFKQQQSEFAEYGDSDSGNSLASDHSSNNLESDLADEEILAITNLEQNQNNNLLDIFA